METTNESEKKEKRDVYEIITNRIIEQLEQNIVPWQRPWTNAGLPKNLISLKPYCGINVWLLVSAGYERNYFLTFEQAKKIGAKIKKGEKGHLVAFWKRDEVTDEKTGEKKQKSFLRYHFVFNVEQCLNIPESKIPVADKEKENNPIKVCEAIVSNMPQKPEIRHKEQQAYYNPIKDYINMPRLKSFKDSESYYSTLFHEMIHASGHKTRLARKEIVELKEFGTEPYSQEELVAEMGSCFLKSYAGIATVTENSIAYIQHWLKKLKSDKKFIVQASANAQKATDFILGLNKNESRGNIVQEAGVNIKEE